jgi:hypothetical protein
MNWYYATKFGRLVTTHGIDDFDLSVLFQHVNGCPRGTNDDQRRRGRAHFALWSEF